MPSPTSRVPSFDLYRELEVDPDATTKTIDAAWRSLVKRYHPDANPTIGSERIRRMNVAHDWLMDPVLRARYDATRQQRRTHVRRTKPSAWAPAPAPQPVRIASSGGTWSTPAKIAVYAGWCLASVLLAYIASVVAAVVLSGANVTGIAAAFMGEDGALTLIQLLGNILFAGALGYLVAVSFTDAFEWADDDGTLVIVGAVAALGVTFGFPVFALSYLTGLAAWMATDGAGFPSIAVLSTIEAAFVGLVVAGTASVRRQ